jgi:single-strand DNA-binding protein
MNTLHIIGSVGNTPEMRSTSTGTPVCTFNVAVNEKHGANETTTWFRVTTWGKLAETCNRYVNKGKLIEVTGSVSANAFTRKNGEVGCSLEVNAKEVEFLGGKRSDADDTGLTYTAPKVPDGFVKVDDDPDFLPF